MYYNDPSSALHQKIQNVSWNKNNPTEYENLRNMDEQTQCKYDVIKELTNLENNTDIAVNATAGTCHVTNNLEISQNQQKIEIKPNYLSLLAEAEEEYEEIPASPGQYEELPSYYKTRQSEVLSQQVDQHLDQRNESEDTNNYENLTRQANKK